MDVSDENQVTRPGDPSAIKASRSGKAPFAVSAETMALVLLGIVVLRLWIMPIGSSFWVDEAGTFWMVKDGIPQLLHKMLEWPSPMTPFYGLVAWAAYWAGGAREYVLRLPSVLAIALSSLLLFRLSRRLFGKASAFPAAVVFICSKEVAFSSCDARPYAFLLLFTVAATLALCVWLETGAARHGAVYVGLAALMAYTHYLGSVVWCAHACYALVRLREGSRVQAKHLMVACAALGALVAPLAPFLLRLFASRSAHVFSDTPHPEALAAALAPPVLIAAVALGVLAARIIYGPVAFRGETKRSAFVLALTLWAIPLLVFCGVSVLTAEKLFVPRYLIQSDVGLALLAGLGIGCLRPAVARSMVTVSIMIWALGAFGSATHLWPIHGHEDWRSAMAAVRQRAGHTQMPVILQSGFVESSTMNLGGAGQLSSYLMAPLSIYPGAGKIIPVPNKFDEAMWLYLDSSILPTLRSADRFLLITRNTLAYNRWITARLPQYAAEPIEGFGDVKVTYFSLPRENSRIPGPTPP